MSAERQLQTAIDAPNKENQRALETGVEHVRKARDGSNQNLSLDASRGTHSVGSWARPPAPVRWRPSIKRRCGAFRTNSSVERASLLLFDAARTMRFVAWSGLSEEYRTAVDGHSPWSPDETNATPVAGLRRRARCLARGVSPVLRREGIRALAFVPLQFGSKLLGKFMLYYREPHAFSDEEIATAQQIADHVAFALEHHRISVALDAQLVAERELRQQRRDRGRAAAGKREPAAPGARRGPHGRLGLGHRERPGELVRGAGIHSRARARRVRRHARRLSPRRASG